jgi:solute carrier family 30 (zinc transporter), member 2
MTTNDHQHGHTDAVNVLSSPRDADYVSLTDPEKPRASPSHSHSHSHGHGHDHDHDHKNDAAGSEPAKPEATQAGAARKLWLVTAIALIFMLMEFIGGYIAGSLAVISDAVHMLTDVLGFAIALTVIWIGKRPSSDTLSFGFHRVEVVGALVSILVIWVLTGVLVYSAVLRCRDFLKDDAPEVVDGKTMFIIALIGLVMNVVMMQVLSHGGDGHGHSHGISVGGGDHGHSHSHGHGHSHDHGEHNGHDDKAHNPNHNHDHDHDQDHDHHQHGHDLEQGEGDREGTGEGDDGDEPKKKRGTKFENLNIQAAYLHVLGDLLQSVGVTIAGAVIWWKPSWQLADPIMTFVFSLLVVGTTMSTVKESLHILMEGTPRQFPYAKVEAGLTKCRDVIAVHDLHIWSLSSNKPALAVHLVSENPEESLASAQKYLIDEGITHSTIQIERPSMAYPQQCVDHGWCK